MELSSKHQAEVEAVEYNPAITYSRRLTVFLHSLLFVGGFTLVFVAGWGGAATLVGGIFAIYKPLLAKAGGIIIIIFGLANLGVLRIPWLMYDTRPQWEAQRKKGFFASGMMGVFFAAGWTPCIGTTLGAILTLAVSQETSGLALVLSGAYALGLGIPFLAIGLSMDRAASFVTRFRHSLQWIQKVSGVFLIVIGLLMVTNQMFYISIWAQRNGLFLDLPLGAAAAPTLLIALVAGLFSFLSPCVLPLVPAYIGYLGGHAFRETQ
jgi:cytochrome c-type biogenesis protein